jgi:translation initiation factor 5B
LKNFPFKYKRYACVLAFDVKINEEAKEFSKKNGIKIFEAKIIYHLFDQFTAYV